MIPRIEGKHLLFEVLLKRAEQALEYLTTEWRRDRRVRPLAVTWAGEPVRDDSGRLLDDAVVCRLPDDPDLHARVLNNMILRTRACAVLVVRPRGAGVRAVYETADGTMCWDYEVEDRADTKLLVRRSTRRNRGGLGLLWRPN